jgi:anti-anti-sigma regulatory factor
MTFKIQRAAEEDVVTFIVCGRIKAQEVAELKRIFEVEGNDHRIVLDLKEVKLADQDAVRFLARCEANGIRLVDCPAYIREWIAGERP